MKKRTIHNNFMTVRSTARCYHRNKIPSLFLKLDIAKAFDSVRWDDILALMQHLGFLTCWHDWIPALLSSSSSWVFLNG
ncbi:reverse transcriptase domain-containing protein, partial [Klebsiella pneumoniae]